MAKKPVGLFKGCAIGCGVIASILVIGVIVISVRTWMPLQSSGKSLAALEERFGPPESYTPALDGALPAERVQAFLDVRRSLAAQCAEFVTVQQQLQRMARLDEKETLSAGEVAQTLKGLFDVSTGVAPMIGDYFEKRNRALLESEMGLGEYTYVFALAYREQFLEQALHAELFSEGGPLSPEFAAALRAMLTNQRDAWITEGRANERRRLIEQEIEAMERDPQRLPWQDELPRAVGDSLAPFRDRLDEAYCRSSAGIAMDRDSQRALIIALE